MTKKELIITFLEGVLFMTLLASIFIIVSIFQINWEANRYEQTSNNHGGCNGYYDDDLCVAWMEERAE